MQSAPRTPRPHQTEALRYATGKPAIALIMEMRLGKTLVAVRWMARRIRCGKDWALVITPASTTHVWERELELEGLRGITLMGTTKQKLKALDAAPGPSIIITNPEGIRAYPELLTARPWAAVIADESGGWLTNAKSQITKLLLKRSAHIPNRAILTGLADPSGPENFVTQMLFTFDSFMGCDNFWEWQNKFMTKAYFGWELKPTTKQKVKDAVKLLAFRKTTKQAGLFVPKVYQTRYVTLSAKLRSIYKQICRDMDCGQGETKWTVVTQGWLSMLAGGVVPKEFDPDRLLNSQHKANELVSLLKGELKGKRIVVWARYKRELSLIMRRLGKEGIRCGRLDGDTPRRERSALLDLFREGGFPILVAQSSVGQYALNISHANAMIYYSNIWNWGIRGQTEKRLDDMTKKEPVLVVDLVTRGTLDEAVLSTLRERKQSTKFFMSRMLIKARKAKVI